MNIVFISQMILSTGWKIDFENNISELLNRMVWSVEMNCRWITSLVSLTLIGIIYSM